MVDKRTLEFILSDQQEELEERGKEALCRRTEETLVDLTSPQAQVVIGVRRSGKSTLCYQALHAVGVKSRASERRAVLARDMPSAAEIAKKFAYADFDDERLYDLKAEQLNDVLEVLYKIYGDFNYLFLDEIQNVKGWHLFVNRMLRKKMHVIITGSNAKLLSGELATHLSGRNKEIPLFPFSFREFCTQKQVETERKTTKAEGFRRAAFDEYMKQGGFPELMTIADNKSYVKDLVNNILQRDIEQRYKVKHKAAFESLAHHLLNNAPTIVVTRDLTNTFGFKSEHTAKNYVNYLKQAYMLLGVQKYSTKSKVRVAQEKVYAIDVAMMNRRENAFAGDNLGHRLETLVLIHLMRKCKMEGLDVYYLNERSGECDFVVCNGRTAVQAIQVSYDISAEKTRKRELSGLLLAAEKTGCKDLLLLTDHESGTVEAKGMTIEIQPVYEWCLELGL